jgi:hypothetical protein
MNTEERLDHIEATVAATTQTVQTLAESHVILQGALRAMAENQTALQRTVADLQGIVGALAGKVDALAVKIDVYIVASGAHAEETGARLRRIEENLDGLIRAITAEHSNGKTGTH